MDDKTAGLRLQALAANLSAVWGWGLVIGAAVPEGPPPLVGVLMVGVAGCLALWSSLALAYELGKAASGDTWDKPLGKGGEE